jgi:vitamin B12 transporter
VPRLSTATAILAITALPAFAQDAPFQLDDIIFSAGLTALDAARVGVSVDVVTEEDLEDTGDIQLTDYLARLPGVTVSQNGPFGTATNLRIRGAGDTFIPVYIDGILVNDPTATSGDFNGFGTLTTANIARIEVLRGSQSAIYGANAVAGVVSITTGAGDDAPEGTSHSFSLEVGSYNTVQSAYALSQRSGNLSLDFGVSAVRSDGFSSADENAGNAEADGATSTRVSLGFAYDLTDQLTIGINGFVERGEGDFDEFGPADGTPGDDFGTTEMRGLRAFAEYRAGSWEHDLTFTYLETDRRQTSTTPFAFSTFDNTFEGERQTASYVATTDGIRNTRLSFGAEWRQDTAIYSNLTAGRERITTASAFAEAVWSPSDLLDVTASLRFEDNSTFGEQTTGRLAFSYRATPSLTLRGALATGYRAPSMDELYGVYPASGPFRGNPNLQPESSQSAELGAVYEYANGGSFGGTVFYLAVEDLITFQSCGAFPCPGATFSTLINAPGTSEFQGLELEGTMPLGESTVISGAYTYTDARLANGARIAEVPRHALALSVETALTDAWTLNADLQLAADTVDSNGPLEDYATVDSTITYALSDGIDAYFRIENLFDEQYQTARGYGTSDRAFYLGLRASF